MARANAAKVAGRRGGSATLEVGDRCFPVAQKGAWKRIGSTAMPCLAAASTKRSVLARAKWPGVGSTAAQSKVWRRMSTPSLRSRASVASW